jgi:putative two-component system response regulator
MRSLSESRVLIVDDVKANVDVLVQALRHDYKLSVALDGESALAIARKAKPDLILLDVSMPDMDGYQVCRRLMSDEAMRDIPVILQTALSDAEDEAWGLALGAVDYITKPFNAELLRARVRNHIELKRHRDDLERLVQERTRDLQRTQTVMIESLGTLAEFRDPETGGHIKRTQAYVKALSLCLRRNPQYAPLLTDAYIELLRISAPLHDVGKLGVPDSVLLKPGKLDDAEFEQMKRHTVFGNEALRISEEKLGPDTFLHTAREIAYTHHEKWDGSGYPQGLKKDQIPLSGRLMAVADVYDALISKRVYKPPMPHEKAVEIIRAGSGTHFDPDLAEAFLGICETFRNIALTYADCDEEREMLGGVPAGAATRAKTFLVVEDNEVVREIMRSQLAAAGCAVEVAANGREAHEIFRRCPCDVVLTDIEMPEMDGYALAEALRDLENAGRRPIILAITASDFDLNEREAHKRGFDGYMLKPLDLAVLEAKVATLMKGAASSLLPDATTTGETQ